MQCFLHSACHYWYHEHYGGNTVAAWNTELQENEVAQAVGAGAKEPEVSDAELLAAPTVGAQVEV